MPEFDCSECSERRDLRDNAIFHLFSFFAQDVSEVTWLVLTDDRLLMMACHVVPLDSISVEVVEHCHASLLISSLSVFSVIGLSQTVPSGM